MDPRRLLRSWILVEHVTQTGPPDEMGDPSEESTWSRYRGYVWQEQASESTSNEAVQREQTQLALERSAAGHIDGGDRIINRGQLDGDGVPVPDVGELFEVNGPPWEARNPRTDVVEYVQARLERTS